MADAFTAFAAGPSLINWDGDDIGYAEDRVMIRVQPFWDLVHADSYGGLAGPPADRQLMGAVVQISALITTGDFSVLDELNSFSANSGAQTVGYLPAVGSFSRIDSLSGELIIQGRNETRTFSVATLTEAQELNSSARHRRFQVGWTAEVDDACAMQLFAVSTGTDPCTS